MKKTLSQLEHIYFASYFSEYQIMVISEEEKSIFLWGMKFNKYKDVIILSYCLKLHFVVICLHYYQLLLHQSLESEGAI